jgi:hypothetical protein
VQIMKGTQIFDQGSSIPVCCRENGGGIHSVLATNGIQKFRQPVPPPHGM